MNNIHVINFEITPYSTDVVNYIDSLSDRDIYRIFNDGMSPSILTWALRKIYELELYSVETLLSGSHSPINQEALMELNNAFIFDGMVFSENLNDIKICPNVFVVTIDGIYAGHAYVWIIKNRNRPSSSNKVANILGIRSRSFLIETINEILSSIKKWAFDLGVDYIRILQPHKHVRRHVHEHGFVMGKHVRNDEKLGWLFDNESTGETILVRMLIFREYDCIAQMQE